MADVKWIKIVTDVFDDEKILLIEALPEADSIIVIWFKLLTLAGKQNNSGVFMLNDKLPYTDEMFATIFRRKKSTVQMALKTFEDLGMVEIVDGAVTIPNWGKHQTLDQIENRNEYMRNYMKEYREKQKALANGESKVNSKVNSKPNVNSLEEEGEEDKELEEDKNNNIDFAKIKEQWNKLDKNIPKITGINPSTDRYRLLKARINEHSEEIFIGAIKKVDESSFLKGYVKDFVITFDWFIKPSNFTKVLEGNYDDEEVKLSKNTGSDDYSREELKAIAEKKKRQGLGL